MGDLIGQAVTPGDIRQNALVPELYCSDFDASLRFYLDVLGFDVLYARPEERFAFLHRDGAQLMLEQPADPTRTWLAGELAHPYGRGVNLQVAVADVVSLHEAVRLAEATILVPLEDRAYRVGDVMRSNRQFVVLDPDGYLLRFSESLP